MASTPTPTHNSPSSLKNTICLFDWWLVKTQAQIQGKTSLGVAGVTSRQKEAMRVFSSAPIAKRFDLFTIETVDNVFIALKSLINGQRTIENGFPSEVSKAFQFGFPTDWEQHAEKYCGEDSKTETPKKKNHVLHEDRKKEIEVSENIATDTSNASKLNRKSSDGKTRFSVRLKNLEGGQKRSTSSCSLKSKKNVSPVPLLEETPEKKNHVSHEDRKAIEVPKHVSHELAENIATDPSNVSHLNSNAAGGTKEKQHDVRASNYKQGHKSQNAKTKVLQETDAKEENLTGKKTKRRISLVVPETDAKKDSTAGKKENKKISLVVPETDAKEKSTVRKKIEKKNIIEEREIPGAREEKTVKDIVSPECLSVGRSRSGRLLLPSLEFWRNQMPIYDMHGKVIGIQEDKPVQVPARGSLSTPRKKRRR